MIPVHPSQPNPMRAPLARPTDSNTAATATPQFGSGGALRNLSMQSKNGLIKTFNLISQEYLVAFLALDVVALWITRILKGLDRGRVPYDPTQDPDLKGKPPLQQLIISTKKNISGLNWANGREEALREMLTGPGSLLMPSVVYGLARHRYKDRSFQLKQDTLATMKDSYVHFLKDHAPEEKMTPQRYQQHLKSFLVSRFEPPESQLDKLMSRGTPIADDELKAAVGALPEGSLKRQLTAALVDVPGETLETVLKNDPQYRKVLENRQNMAKMLDSVRQVKHPVSGETTKMTIREYLNTWADAWSKKAAEPVDKSLAEGVDASLKQLNKDLYNVLYSYNREVMQFSAEDSDKVLVRSGKHGHPAKRPLEEYLANMDNFRDYTRRVYKAHRKSPATALTDIAEGTFRRVTKQKAGLSVLATLVAGSYLILLPRFVQKDGHYPAERLFEENNASTEGFELKKTPITEAQVDPVKPAQPMVTQPETAPAAQATPPAHNAGAPVATPFMPASAYAPAYYANPFGYAPAPYFGQQGGERS